MKILTKIKSPENSEEFSGRVNELTRGATRFEALKNATTFILSFDAEGVFPSLLLIRSVLSVHGTLSLPNFPRKLSLRVRLYHLFFCCQDFFIFFQNIYTILYTVNVRLYVIIFIKSVIIQKNNNIARIRKKTLTREEYLLHMPRCTNL